LIAVVVASYLILQQRQVQLEIDPQEEKLLDNATRAGIMQELSGADRIPTDLSIKLGKSKATVVEHLTTLSSAGFVERVATPGRKYVFYRLTQKGKRALLRRAG
jgi:DNA-binding MarR family transcriptional regulator